MHKGTLHHIAQDLDQPTPTDWTLLDKWRQYWATTARALPDPARARLVALDNSRPRQDA